MTIANACRNGFTLVELLVSLVIMSIAATAILPQLQQRIEQSAVDSYTNQLEAGLTQLKATMLSRQGTCEISFPAGAGSEVAISPIDIEKMNIDASPNCPKAINQSDLRIVNLRRNPATSEEEARLRDQEKVELLISQDPLEMTSIGGVAAPQSVGNAKPFLIRVRSRLLHQRSQGFERCLQMEAMTGTLIRGTWIGNDFGTGHCTQNR